MAGKSSVMEAFSRQEEGNRSSRWRLNVPSSTTSVCASGLSLNCWPRPIGELGRRCPSVGTTPDGRDRLGLPVGGQDDAKQDDPGDVHDRNREADERD